jgi:hypothetical protein
MIELDVLIGCEKSRVVANAFEALGHNAWSCDLQPCEVPSNRHIIGDVRDQLNTGYWDLIIVMHPPCTRLCNSGVRWLHEPPSNPPADASEDEAKGWPLMGRDERLAVMWKHLDEGAKLFGDCLNAECDHIAIENPVMHRHAKERIRGYREFAFSTQPWQHGHDEDGPDNEKKRTCFWTVDLPDLVPTGTLDGSTARSSVHDAYPGANRAEQRSRFFPGMAQAMAEQWSEYVIGKLERGEAHAA